MPKIRTDLLLTMTMTPQFLEQKHDAARLEKGRGVILASDKGNKRAPFTAIFVHVTHQKEQTRRSRSGQ